MQEFNCLAELDAHIYNQVFSNQLELGPVGQWVKSDHIIHVVGKILTKGDYPRLCVRWTVPTLKNKGLFGRGLAGYCAGFSQEQLKEVVIMDKPYQIKYWRKNGSIIKTVMFGERAYQACKGKIFNMLQSNVTRFEGYELYKEGVLHEHMSMSTL